MENKTNRPTGMFGFSLVWLGQIVSVLATSMNDMAGIALAEKHRLTTYIHPLSFSLSLP